MYLFNWNTEDRLVLSLRPGHVLELLVSQIFNRMINAVKRRL